MANASAITSSLPFPPDGTYIIFFLVSSYCFWPKSIALSTLALSKGVNVSEAYRESMLVTTKTKFECQKITMDRLEFYEDGKVVFTYMTKEDDEKIGVEAGDHDGVVEIGRNIKGVEVSIFLYQKTDGSFKASLRSNDYVDVADVCMMFGGGGHIKAAGCTIEKPLEEAKAAILAEVKKHI